MCRLGWTSDMELWDLAFHKYSDSRYELSIHFDSLEGGVHPKPVLTAPHRFTFGSGGLTERATGCELTDGSTRLNF